MAWSIAATLISSAGQKVGFCLGGLEPVILELAFKIAARRLPFAFDPAFAFQAVEGRVERAVLHLQQVVRRALECCLAIWCPWAAPRCSVRKISMSSVPCRSWMRSGDGSDIGPADILPKVARTLGRRSAEKNVRRLNGAAFEPRFPSRRYNCNPSLLPVRGSE